MKVACQLCGDTTDCTRCTQCHVVFYCSDRHQREHLAEHQSLCALVQTAIRRLDKEERRLRREEGNDVFEEDVGHFWSIFETRDYMRAKNRLIMVMHEVGTPTALQIALEEGMDCLRLCRGDNVGMRHTVPAFMLRLGDVQDCYDFIKWWATCDREVAYNWGDLDLPYLDIKDADMTEPVKIFEGAPLEHLVALTFIKLHIALGLLDVIHAELASLALPFGLEGELKSFLPMNELISAPMTVQKLFQTMLSQAKEAFSMVHEHNAYFWKAVLDPEAMLQTQPTPFYCTGSPEEVRQMFQRYYQLWTDHPAAMAFVKKNLQEHAL
ncbi:hypothetical protein Poli38472_011257 [Pythium oligandrum]|uniref:MYND-type domain-containing protein n=1 Tax=Pythium oligandrum TaxID=41045 RepID=A0A8K1FQ70_PYTOL|nr:hypothetical protein Poli38472_011257 [Pythium oligandrum]|eukprot:TMW67637.1 hypothetical protein Poli38472_011257 [Pythium oligandrum]